MQGVFRPIRKRPAHGQADSQKTFRATNEFMRIDAERAKFASSSAGQHVDLQSSFRPPISYRPLSTEPKETRQEQHTFHSA